MTRGAPFGFVLLLWCSPVLAQDNLLDQRYREHGSGIEGYGRSVRATAEVTF